MKHYAGIEKKRYRIEIKQDLSDRFLATLGDYQKRTINNRILLEGEFTDQSALFGLMQRLYALHIEVLAVVPENMWTCVDKQPEGANLRECK